MSLLPRSVSSVNQVSGEKRICLTNKECVCVCVSEVKQFNLTDKDRYIVIASDGVWEFISNEEVIGKSIDRSVHSNRFLCCLMDGPGHACSQPILQVR